jgi:hypothetical protein
VALVRLILDVTSIATNENSYRIFILEGLFSTAFSVLAYFVIPGFPADAKFLSVEEKRYLLHRLEAERGNETITFHWSMFKECFLDWKIWLAFVYPILPSIRTNLTSL